MSEGSSEGLSWDSVLVTVLKTGPDRSVRPVQRGTGS